MGKAEIKHGPIVISGLLCWLKVKNLPAIGETWVQSLSWEDPLEKGMAIHSSVFALDILIDSGVWWAIVHGVPKSWTRLSD